MDWSDWVTYEPKNRDEIVSKIENDGYTYPHYDKSKNGVKFVMCLETIEKDCQATGTTLNEVYPLQTKLFNRRNDINDYKNKRTKNINRN